MMEVWSHGSDASAMHPFGSRSLGWEEVRASWEQAAQAISDGRVSDHQRGVDEEVVVPMGDDAADHRGHRTWPSEDRRRAGTRRLAGDEHGPA